MHIYEFSEFGFCYFLQSDCFNSITFTIIAISLAKFETIAVLRYAQIPSDRDIYSFILHKIFKGYWKIEILEFVV